MVVVPAKGDKKASHGAAGLVKRALVNAGGGGNHTLFRW
jgi:hypothetical protein